MGIRNMEKEGIVTKNYKEQIYSLLKKKILLQKIKVEEKINVSQIAETHNVSRAPVREALLELVKDGLVINKSRVGFFVKKFSKSEAENIIEVRQTLEMHCFKNYFECINRNELEKIYDISKKFDSEITREEYNNTDINYII